MPFCWSHVHSFDLGMRHITRERMIHISGDSVQSNSIKNLPVRYWFDSVRGRARSVSVHCMTANKDLYAQQATVLLSIKLPQDRRCSPFVNFIRSAISVVHYFRFRFDLIESNQLWSDFDPIIVHSLHISAVGWVPLSLKGSVLEQVKEETKEKVHLENGR